MHYNLYHCRGLWRNKKSLFFYCCLTRVITIGPSCNIERGPWYKNSLSLYIWDLYTNKPKTKKTFKNVVDLKNFQKYFFSLFSFKYSPLPLPLGLSFFFSSIFFSFLLIFFNFFYFILFQHFICFFQHFFSFYYFFTFFFFLFYTFFLNILFFFQLFFLYIVFIYFFVNIFLLNIFF